MVHSFSGVPAARAALDRFAFHYFKNPAILRFGRFGIDWDPPSHAQGHKMKGRETKPPDRDLDGDVCMFGIGNTCLPPPLNVQIPPASNENANSVFWTADVAGYAAAQMVDPISQEQGLNTARQVCLFHACYLRITKACEAVFTHLSALTPKNYACFAPVYQAWSPMESSVESQAQRKRCVIKRSLL